MKVGTGIESRSVAEVSAAATRAEELGYDYFSSSETGHNPFLPLVLAAEHTERINLRTSIALAFARSPMDTAYLAWDLQAMSNGRFILGLGSQVRGHIVRRYNMEWSAPAARMREYVLALRAVWDCWQNGTKLDFRGDFYNFNLMPPFFNPGPIENPNVKVYVAAVNSRMQRVAGEVCDGVLLHSFNTPKFTREVVVPKLEEGARAAGRSVADLEVSGGGFIVTGATEEEIAANCEATKRRISFYASTRSYAPVMHTHGWHDTAEKLYRMSIDGQWDQMGEQITDEMLDAFAVIGTYDDIVGKIKERYGPYAGSVGFSIPVHTPDDDARLRSMLRSLQGV